VIPSLSAAWQTLLARKWEGDALVTSRGMMEDKRTLSPGELVHIYNPKNASQLHSQIQNSLPSPTSISTKQDNGTSERLKTFADAEPAPEGRKPRASMSESHATALFPLKRDRVKSGESG
jgi:hypothetical protein